MLIPEHRKAKQGGRKIAGRKQALIVSSILTYPIIFHMLQNEELMEQGGIVLAVYGGLMLLNIIFIAMLALFSLAINGGAVERLSFKEFCGLYLYAGTLPVIISCFAGIFFGIIVVYPLYNMGLVFYTYMIYKKGQKMEKM